MNRLAGMSYALAALTSVSMLVATQAAPMLSRPHDWTIEIKTKEMPLHFQYQGSTLKQLVKAELKFYSATEEENKTTYEYLWFANDKALGLERKSKLNIKEGDAIAIRVLHADDSPNQEEKRAAGKAIMRAFLDAQINHNMVATVKVPVASFDAILSEIQEYNFHPASEAPDEEVHADISLFVESEPEGQRQTLYHFD